MQIDTNLGSYQSKGRVATNDKALPASEPASETARQSNPLNPSFSRTVLSNSLANVLWEVGGSRTENPRTSPSRMVKTDHEERQLNWVRNAYAEYE